VRIALTIAGSDSGAGAGIQADLKTFAAHGVYGITAVTAVTAQNTIGVLRSVPMPSDLVTAQLEAVMSDLGAHAVKTGMLGNAAVVEAVAAAAQDLELPFLVVDPVLVSSSGEALLDDEGVLALKRELLRRAHAVTPNIQEAEVLSGVAIRNEQDRREAARRIFALGPVHVVITGGDIPEGASDIAPHAIVDLLYDGDVFTEYAAERVPWAPYARDWLRVFRCGDSAPRPRAIASRGRTSGAGLRRRRDSPCPTARLRLGADEPFLAAGHR
jgi:hydroxymethylpyrimidine/phosphomethylpyrimidine kinase